VWPNKVWEKGYCAVVDDKGKVMAHPNTAWVSQSHDLSSDEVVKKIKIKKAGAFEFYSSTSQQDMIGGFAKVDDTGWGIMILRPKAEIDLPFKNIKLAILSWVVIGVFTALLIAFFVTQKITRPLSTLVAKSKQLDVRSESFKLGKAPKNCPIEIRVLWNTISKLIVNFQEANSEVKSLSSSLNKDLRKVVVELRENNLKKSRNKDLLTGISTKECFKKELAKALMIHKGEDVGVILIEVDNYQSLLTKEGQDAGNFIIKHVAKILGENIRSGDMAARYNDTNQFVIYIDECNPKSLQGTAEKLHTLVEASPAIWKEEAVYIRLSLGTVNHKIDNKLTLDSLLTYAEQALEKSKSAGLNNISSYRSCSITQTA
jgi:diguanylate cyclase (GGDEF)-like protein